MWPSINHLENGPPERLQPGPGEVLQECEAVARTLPRWTVAEVDVSGGQIRAERRSRLGWRDRISVRVEADGDGSAVTVAVRGRAPAWRLERVLEGYLVEVRRAVELRRTGREAGT